MMARLPLALVVFGLLTGTLSSSAAARPDLSTPKSAALAFARALETGDEETVRATSTASADADYAKMRNVSAVYMALARFHEAAAARYGAAAAAPVAAQACSFSTNVAAGTPNEDGDSAYLTLANAAAGEPPLILARTGGAWRVDTHRLFLNVTFAMTVAQGGRIARNLDATTQEVAAGRYATMAEAELAFRMRSNPDAARPTTVPDAETRPKPRMRRIPGK
ncbi:MAG: hypothetical protein ACAI43_24535 [Phycisphaerae bacterium]|nr:hypothetical protein [Tepidisphaeraceae bacterium]